VGREPHRSVSRRLMETPITMPEAEDTGEHRGSMRVEQILEEESRTNFKKLDLQTLTKQANNIVRRADGQ